MHGGLDRQLWDHTAPLICLLANVHRDKKKHPRAFTVAEIHPYGRTTQKPGVAITPANIGLLKVFLPKKKG